MKEMKEIFAYGTRKLKRKDKILIVPYHLAFFFVEKRFTCFVYVYDYPNSFL